MKKKYVLSLGILFIIGIGYYLCLPNQLFNDPYSTVVNDHKGQLIGAKIAKDGQWRFPIIRNVPKNFESAILTFEDKRFKKHWGVDFIALGRALVQNIKAGKIKSGASTITMQVIRLSRKGRSRNIYQKIIEIILATRLEWSYSKEHILRLYATHAPFGGNVVGLETASWRYFKKDPSKLTIAESAMLAVLPNAPSLIHLSKNRPRLLAKRNQLLLDMKEEGLLSEEDYELSLLEEIPDAPYPLPSSAKHLVEYVHRSTPESSINTTLDATLQQTIIEVGNYHHSIVKQSDIHNLSILVLDTKTGNVLGYLGNAPNTNKTGSVDMIQAHRSSGSILKPFLHAFLLEEGKMLPHTLLKDVPIQIQGFNPKNYNRRYSGAVAADEALARSLNIPAVLNLQTYGVEPFIHRLHELGIHSINKNADHYGLSLILGGGEVSLWELCGAYASMGRTLMRFTQEESKYSTADFHEPKITSTSFNKADSYVAPVLSASSIYHTFKAMLKVVRPGNDGNWQEFESSSPIAWKTGTSYGHRDAWAIGVSPTYTIGVWVGNANGEGKHGLIGVEKAGPILFDVFNRLPKSRFFSEPIDDFVLLSSCRKSGHLASPTCPEIDSIFTHPSGQKSEMCPYHKRIHLDIDGNRVSSKCASPSTMIHKAWFELPPNMAFYYRQNHPDYHKVPTFRRDCMQEATSDLMSFLYPSVKTKIYLPLDIDGVREKAIFQASHRDPATTLYWHLDQDYLGFTEGLHSMAIEASKGLHTVSIIDPQGNMLSQSFEIIQ